MDVVAAVASFIGLTGQCLQGCNFLRNFFNNVRDAPQVIRDTAGELHLLILLLDAFRNILHGMQASHAATDCSGARSALLFLEEAVSQLTKFVVKYASIVAPGTGRRLLKTWESLDHAWRRPQLKKHLQRLQQAKISLVVAQSNIVLLATPFQTTFYSLSDIPLQRPEQSTIPTTFTYSASTSRGLPAAARQHYQGCHSCSGTRL
jgi:hypothetical protein